MTISYNLLPTFNDLFLDYINNFDNLKKFYEYDYRDYEDFHKCIELKKQTYMSGKNFFRSDICEILRKQNQQFNSSQKCLDNISLLGDHDTFAVVTGQQLGMLSGPFYTILKAINTIQLSEKLSQLFPGYKFVPVFWLESDDHDFLEVNNINLLSRDNILTNIKYFERGIESEKYLKPAGDIVFDQHINDFINKLESEITKTDFSDSLFNAVRKTYKTGTDFKTAFTQFINTLLKDCGLIFIDPSDKEIKKHLKPIFETELKTFPQLCETIINTTVEIEELYTAQVKPRAINLFYIHEKNRYLIEPRENEIFALKNSRQKFSKEELFNILESNPERFSPNVVTRPICQDYILPTIAYIGGPSEIAYFAQFKDVYKLFNISMPVIYPRTSVTIIENKVNNFLEKNDLKFDELFDEKSLSNKLVGNTSDINAEKIFSNFKDEITALFYTYEQQLKRVDSNQSNSFVKKNQQYLDSVKVLEDKFINSQAKQNEVVSVQLKKVLTNILPDNNLQERVLNISYFLNKYGMEFINHMMQEVDIDEFEHQLIPAEPSRDL